MWEVSSPDENLNILILMKIVFWINGMFCFNPGVELKLRLYGEKWCFVLGWNIYFFACNRNLFFILKTMAGWDEIPTRLHNNNFIPGWNLSYNQLLKTFELSYDSPKVYRYEDRLSFFPPRRLKPRINFCSQICTSMK